MSEVIEYRGEQIDVGKIRDWCSRAKNSDGTPYFTEEETEAWVKREVLQKKREIGRWTGARYEKHGGFHLAFYQKERQMLPKAFDTKLSDHEALLLVRKLFRHFGRKWLAKNEVVRFYGNSQSGSCGWTLRLSHNPSIGLICHEIAHRFERKHNKKMMQWIKRLVHYCEKKGWCPK